MRCSRERKGYEFLRRGAGGCGSWQNGPPWKAGPTRARGTQEHSQEWLCHKQGLVEDDGAGFGYVGVEFVDCVGVLLLDYAAL